MARPQEKVIVPRQDLPPVSLLSDGTYGYIMRYRVVSEDQNRFSHWSPIRELAVPLPTQVGGSVVVSGSVGSVIWGDEESRPDYDIFVKFDSADYVYHGTSSIHQYSFIIPDGTETIQVAVQIASTDNTRSSLIEVYESDPTSVVQLEVFELSRFF